jgi:hypothetical protein
MLALASGFGGSKLYFRGDYKVFFDPQNEQRQTFEQMQRVFNDTISATIIIAPTQVISESCYGYMLVKTGSWELRTGIGKVYWGVTGSQHLVDVSTKPIR